MNGHVEKGHKKQDPDNPHKNLKALLHPQVYYFDVEAMQETQVHKANLVVQNENGASQKISKMIPQMPLTSFAIGYLKNTVDRTLKHNLSYLLPTI